jgi:arylsulfatase A-like enzyme
MPSAHRGPEGIAAWDDIPDDEKAFQARLMEVYAGFLEHTDAQVGRLIDELEARGIRDNTLILYIFPTTAPPPKAWKAASRS